MNIEHLIYFITTVKYSSFTKAANSLFISQSTISKAIRSLEHMFSIEIVDRTSKKFKLTSEGEIFYHSAVKIVQQYKDERQLLETRLVSRSGTLILGVPPVTITIVHKILADYQLAYPNIQLRVLEIGANKVYSLLKTGAIDVGILIHPVNDAELINYPVIKSEVVCVTNEKHAVSKECNITWKMLKEKNFYLLNDTFMLHDMVMSCCKSNGFMPNIILESAQWDLLIEAVCTSDGVTFLPKPIVDKFCFNKVHQFSVHKPDLLWIPTVTYHREKFITTPIKLFLEFIKKKSYLEKNREEFLFCV